MCKYPPSATADVPLAHVDSFKLALTRCKESAQLTLATYELLALVTNDSSLRGQTFHLYLTVGLKSVAHLPLLPQSRILVHTIATSIVSMYTCHWIAPYSLNLTGKMASQSRQACLHVPRDPK